MTQPRPFKNPFPATKVRAQLDEADLRTFMEEERAAGKPDRMPDIPCAFLLRMNRSSTEGTGLASFRRPDWVARIAKANRPPAEAVDALVDRAAKTPNEAVLREAQIVANDIGRLPDGGKLLRSKVTQQLVDRLIGA